MSSINNEKQSNSITKNVDNLQSASITKNVDNSSSITKNVNDLSFVSKLIVINFASTSKINDETFNFRFDLRFKYKNDLIYFAIENEREWFCISTALKQKIFQLIHDQIHHDDFHRTYDRITFFVYIHQLSKRFRAYINHCSKCQLNQIKRHLIYDELSFIIISIIFFHIIVMNWIVALSNTSNDYNMLLIIIFKFTKRILLIVDKNIWTTTKWTKMIIIVLISHDWNIFKNIINDKNTRFMSDFWKTIIKKLDIIMLTSTTYHSQIDDQSKRINQIIEITLRFHFTTFSNVDWKQIFSYLQIESNNVKHFFIDFASNELIYDFKINDVTNMFNDLSSKNYNRLKFIKREEIESIMTFVNVISKTRYDLHHKIINNVIEIDFMIYLRFHQNYIISNLFNKKLFNQRVKSFKMLKTIDKVKQIYRLKLFSIMKIHSVIFITQLKSATSDIDFYERIVDKNSSSIKKENFHSKTFHYEIKRLLNKRMSRNQSQYLVKWLNYDNEHNVWSFFRILNNADELITNCEIKQKKRQIVVDEQIVDNSIMKSKIVVVKREREKSRDRDWRN